jgi:hypothetical protein
MVVVRNYEGWRREVIDAKELERGLAKVLGAGVRELGTIIGRVFFAGFDAGGGGNPDDGD